MHQNTNLTNKDFLKDAVQGLLERCDGAQSNDGMGYNKFDSRFAKSLTTYKKWSRKQRVVAYNMLRKYKGQLEEMGIPYELIVHPDDEEETISELIAASRPKLIDTDGKQFIISFPFEWKTVNAVKKLIGRRWVADKEFWTVPQNIENVKQLDNFAHKMGFAWTHKADEASDYIEEAAEADIEASSAKDAKLKMPPTFGNKNLKPYPFQRAGIKYALKKDSILIGDEMGLGKTIQGMGLVEYKQAYPCLVMCPSIAKINWKREIEAWLPGRTVQIVSGGKGKVEYDTDYVIINYDIIAKRADELVDAEFQSLIADESHYLKNGRSKRGRAAVNIVYGNKEEDLPKFRRPKEEFKPKKIIPLRILMSGTPIPNRPIELVNQLRVIGKLGEFGGFGGFTNRYCDPQPSRFGVDYSGSANIEELNARMREKFMVRRKKKDVLTELPDKIQTVLNVEISNRPEYNRAVADIVKFAGKLAIQKQEFLDSISELSKDEQEDETDKYRKDKERNAERAKVLVKIEVLKQVCVKGKMRAVKEWVANFLDTTDEKLVIFAHHKDVVETLTKEFDAVQIKGGSGYIHRQKAIDEFQNGDVRVIVCSMLASGVAITLTASSNVLFVEQGWNPAQHDQASDRCHRIGQKNAVNVYYMNGKDTIDDWIYNLIEQKRKVIDGVIDGVGVKEKIVSSIVKHLTGNAKT